MPLELRDESKHVHKARAHCGDPTNDRGHHDSVEAKVVEKAEYDSSIAYNRCKYCDRKKELLWQSLSKAKLIFYSADS